MINELHAVYAKRNMEVLGKALLKAHPVPYRVKELSGYGPRIVKENVAVTVDWDSVLKGLPATFTLDHIYRASAVKGKPRGYLRHVVVKWARQRKIKRTGWGRYRKVQGR